MARKTRKEIEEDRIATAKRKSSVQCRCSKRVPYYTFNKKGWGVCNFCGTKVLKPEDEFKNKILSMLGGKE